MICKIPDSGYIHISQFHKYGISLNNVRDIFEFEEEFEDIDECKYRKDENSPREWNSQSN
nr:MAG TPA: hypothetical protein [Caudoviricetes sp.]